MLLKTLRIDIIVMGYQVIDHVDFITRKTIITWIYNTDV